MVTDTTIRIGATPTTDMLHITAATIHTMAGDIRHTYRSTAMVIAMAMDTTIRT